ncbi:hypothetical protein JW926_04130 [Candidatus Sumerlaeota bacterium]|nr:hypothetical protein [Candidatus Sumerlaeota bacterium]
MNAIKVILALIMGNLIPHLVGLIKSDTSAFISVVWIFVFVILSLLSVEFLGKKLKKKNIDK